MFVMGRGVDFFIAKEGSLKIKEIAYISSEAYAANALKHGPFALLDEFYPVLFISSNIDYCVKNKNTISEILARNSPLFLITTEESKKKFQFESKNITYIIIPSHAYGFLLANIVLQIIAFHLSVHLGHNPDFPRNLAKVVTVD
jgi:glucosamine--fructose-6-phosphate aminotransferase (isomerizing)